MPSALQNVGELEYSKLERDIRPDIVSSGPTRAVLQPLPILHLATNRDALLACNNAGGNAHRAPNNSTAVLVGSFSPQRTFPSKLNYLMRRSAPTKKKKPHPFWRVLGSLSLPTLYIHMRSDAWPGSAAAGSNGRMVDEVQRSPGRQVTFAAVKPWKGWMRCRHRRLMRKRRESTATLLAGGEITAAKGSSRSMFYAGYYNVQDNAKRMDIRWPPSWQG